MKKASRAVLVVPLALLPLAVACGQDSAVQPVAAPSGTPLTMTAIEPSAEPSPTGDHAALAAVAVRRLTDEQLAGQVLMPYAYGADATRVDAASAAANQKLGGVNTPGELVAKFHLGGLILVSFTTDDPTGATNAARNVQSPAQVRAFTAGLQQAAVRPGGAPLLIGTDQEYGVVTRVRDGVTMLPSAMGLGAARRPDLTQASWHAAGEELAAMGINLDFAPVADTLGPQGSAVLGSRSFGDDPKANADQVKAAVQGLQRAGIMAALKHFPGHGHTTGDSHDELPLVTQSQAQLMSQDWPPFAAGIDAGVGAVMSGHLDVKAVDPGVPATFSHRLMTDVLRGQLKFTGVAITDAMTMAPAMKWPAGEAAVKALRAGNDIVLMPPDITAARDGILAALKDGSLKRDRLVEAATRILTLRFRTGGTPQPALSTVNSPEHQTAVLAAGAASITVLRGKCSGPLVTGSVLVTASDGREVARVALVKALQAADVQVVAANGAVVHLVGYGDQQIDVDPDAAVTVAMDTPYLLAAANSPTLIATYSSSPLSLTALAAVLAGKASAPGRSPVAVTGLPRSACAK